MDPRIQSAVLAVASQSKHPLSKAIAEYYRSNNTEDVVPDKIEEITGRGIFGMFDNYELWLGSERWISECSGNSAYKSNNFRELRSTGHSIVFLAVRNLTLSEKIKTILADPIRPESAEVLGQL